jgi:predicted phosphodiesterase
MSEITCEPIRFAVEERHYLLKIAHVSDLHIDSENAARNWRGARRVLAAAVEDGFDHLVITGDIVQSPTPENYGLARKLLGEFDLLKSNRLSLVIGNHEIYGGVLLAKEIMTFPGRCRATDYDLRVREFRGFFPEAFECARTTSPADVFPYVKVVGDCAIIGINSIAPYATVGNPFASRGRVTPDDLAKVIELLARPEASGKNNIVIMHHQFCKQRLIERPREHALWRKIEWRSLKLQRLRRIVKVFRALGITIVFHGHIHENSIYFRDRICFANAGGSVDNPIGSELGYNLAALGDGAIDIAARVILPLERPNHPLPPDFDLVPELVE